MGDLIKKFQQRDVTTNGGVSITNYFPSVCLKTSLISSQLQHIQTISLNIFLPFFISNLDRSDIDGIFMRKFSLSLLLYFN